MEGVRSAVVGYLVLAGTAAATFVLLRATNLTEAKIFLENSELDVLSHPSPPDLVLSAGGALTGVLMIVANRRSVIAGPLLAAIAAARDRDAGHGRHPGSRPPRP